MLSLTHTKWRRTKKNKERISDIFFHSGLNDRIAGLKSSLLDRKSEVRF